MVRSREYRTPPPQLLARFGVPWKHIVYSVIPLVYFAISADGKVRGQQLKQARDTLSLFRRLEPPRPDPLQEWAYIKEQALKTWHDLCY